MNVTEYVDYQELFARANAKEREAMERMKENQVELENQTLFSTGWTIWSGDDSVNEGLRSKAAELETVTTSLERRKMQAMQGKRKEYKGLDRVKTSFDCPTGKGEKVKWDRVILVGIIISLLTYIIIK